MLFRPYFYLTAIMAPLFGHMLSRRIKKGKEDESRLSERKGRPVRVRPEGCLVWFHGASVGESLSALPVIEKLLKERPECHVMVTTGTVTSARLMADRLPARAFHQYIPVDHPRWVSRFLDHWQPDAVIWLESDFWPNMVFEIKKRKYPLVLLNARMSEESFQRWTIFARQDFAALIGAFDFCLTQSEDEKKRLDHFDHADVRVTDNLKYAAAPLPFDAGELESLQALIQGRPAWQFVSTHPGEEEQAFQVHKKLKENYPGLLTIIVPRHPMRGADITAMAEKENIPTARRSAKEAITDKTQIYLADTLGELGLFFNLCPVTAMGGSFVEHGGHNPIEPGQYGNLIILGPHMFNFKDITAEFLKRQAAVQVSGSDDLPKILSRAFDDAGFISAYGAQAQKLTDEKSTALENVWGHLSPWLEKALQSKSGAASV